MRVALHAQTTQNKRFAISLQYVKKEISDKVNFFLADKHESLATNWYYDYDKDDQAFTKFLK